LHQRSKPVGYGCAVQTLNQRLGLGESEAALIVTCDDLGSSHAANSAIYDSLRNGWATSAGLMVPAPWAREAAATYRGEDVGVHLTLNSEHELFRWGPITQAPSLLSGEGGFPRRVDDLWDHADLDECRRECRSQLERAIYWGFDVTHIDSHLGALVLRPEFFDVLLDLAVEFQLPIRLPNESVEQSAGFPFRRLARDEGILFPDNVVLAGPGDVNTIVKSCLQSLSSGITELVFLPAVDTPELRALAPHEWQTYADQFSALQADSELHRILQSSGIKVIDYRTLRDAQPAR
jgi:chitin disaccharide deacetylase